MKKRNFIAKDLMSKKYKPRVIKAKKGKGSFKRKKSKIKVLHQSVELLLKTFLSLFLNIL